MQAGMTSVVVQDKYPWVTMPDGELVAMECTPSNVDFLTDGTCQHSLTMCSECIEDWAEDYDLLSMTVLAVDGVIVLPIGESS